MLKSRHAFWLDYNDPDMVNDLHGLLDGDTEGNRDVAFQELLAVWFPGIKIKRLEVQLPLEETAEDVTAVFKILWAGDHYTLYGRGDTRLAAYVSAFSGGDRLIQQRPTGLQ